MGNDSRESLSHPTEALSGGRERIEPSREKDNTPAAWPRPGLYIKKNVERPLSGPALGELLRSVLEKGASLRFRSRGFSMAPFIRDGDVIMVEPLGGAHPALGDVAAFIHPETGKVGVHRIIGGQGDACLTKGDNNPGADGLIPRANILGRVKKVERNGREVGLGLGPEKIIISFLSRCNLFTTVLNPAWRRLGPLLKRPKT